MWLKSEASFLAASCVMVSGRGTAGELVTVTRSSAPSFTADPESRPAESSFVTSTRPFRIVIVDRWPSGVGTTSATTTVPRMAVTALGVLISMTSPGFINPLETATEIRPSPSWMVETPGTSVMVRTERSRAVTVALPPRSTRTNERSPVAIRSRRKTSSLKWSG